MTRPWNGGDPEFPGSPFTTFRIIDQLPSTKNQRSLPFSFSTGPIGQLIYSTRHARQFVIHRDLLNMYSDAAD